MTSRGLLTWVLLLAASGYAAQRLRSLPEPVPDAHPSFAMPEAPQAPAVRVLFIGNSLTHAYDMPGMLVGLARAGGVNLEVEQHTPGGARLVQQAASPEVAALLERGGWTAVVLQEQSQWPAFAEDQVRREVDPFAAQLAQRARAKTPRVRILLYQTPARRNGDPDNADNIPELGTYQGMQARLNAAYRRIARQVSGTVMPAGAAWQLARRERPDIDLYADNVHPNREGAYLIACVFYAGLFGRSAEGTTFLAGVDPGVAAALQRFAWRAARAERNL